MVWLVEGIYAAALVAGLIWLVSRMRKYVGSAKARKEVEARWAESFSEDEFQAFLETLRQKRDSQANAGKDNNQEGRSQSD